MASLVIFSVDVSRLARFYEDVLGVKPLSEASGDIRLGGNREEVLIHSIPDAIATDIEISTPPASRSGSALKPVFDVTSLDFALDAVQSAGGEVTDRTFSFDGLTRHDVLDPDGNIIQLRCHTS
jgi:catechol 2,3-dioxygenase-like lactoylglutathione lyase family enzyme